MRDFYAPPASGPLDQADGLRRLFGGRRQRVVALARKGHKVVALDAGAVDKHAAAHDVEQHIGAVVRGRQRDGGIGDFGGFFADRGRLYL